jgi:uncharacterized membrane protein YeaQ/YmgE (transglycosylase-associated protein family)
MSPMTFAIWVLMGLLAALLAGSVTKRGAGGWRQDVLLGLAGSLGADGFGWALGVSRWPVAVAVVTFVGAVVSITLQRWLWPAGWGRAVEGAALRHGAPARPVWGKER